ncbi:YfbR-like 5'-deoxynucleotidase, partial [Clostridioides difficile]|nr:YfbR-like 5'-deoxynucleotidase [Clostridioides difficile]
IKYYNPDIRDAYREVEQFSAHKLLHMLPEALRPSFDPLLREGYDPELRTLVKAADKLSAHIKCVEELKAGNAEFKQAAEQTLEALRGYGLPELDYFLEHFLPAFGLTLDELQ